MSDRDHHSSENEEAAARMEAHRADREAEPDAATRAKRELAAALRKLLDALPGTDIDEARLRNLSASIEEEARAFAEARPDPSAAASAKTASYSGMEAFYDRSPLTGVANPMAPPATLWVDQEEQIVRGEVEYGYAYEGGPGLVHGGFLAAYLDEALGFSTVFSGSPGMTGELVVRYLGPTRIRVPLRLEARFEGREGRRIRTSAALFDGDRKTVEAEGLFISVNNATFAGFAKQRRERLED